MRSLDLIGYEIGCGIGRQVEEAIGVTWKISGRSSSTVCL